MPKVQLTAAAVERFKAAPGVRTEYFDKLLPGFALRVSGPTTSNPSGSKSWVVFYRFGGKLRRDTIGKWPVLELGEAREKARKMLAAVSENRDPHPEVQLTHSVESAIDEFMKRHMTAHQRSASYINETRRIFDTIVLPRWRGRAVQEISRRDVLELIDEIADGRASVRQGIKTGKGAPIMANRAVATLRVFFKWLVGRGSIETSPVSNIPRPAGENPRDRVLSDNEIVCFWEGCETLGWPFGSLFRLLLLTAQRRDEVGSLAWSEVDLAAGIWRLPRERAKNDRAHAVPLSQAALGILTATPRIKGSPFIFTTTGERPASGFSKAKKRLDARMTELAREMIKDGTNVERAASRVAAWTLHDLRRTAATGMAGLNIAPHVVDRILNHVSGTIHGVAAIYNRHAYLEERKAALEAWGRYVEGLVRPAVRTSSR